MTSMVFHTGIYKTSMIFPIDIVFLYDINGFSHRYRIFIWSSMVFPIDIVFFYYINWFCPYISYFYMTSTCFPHRYLLRHQWFCPYISYFHMTSTCFPHRCRIFTWHLLVFHIDIVFLYDINGFSHRYL